MVLNQVGLVGGRARVIPVPMVLAPSLVLSLDSSLVLSPDNRWGSRVFTPGSRCLSLAWGLPTRCRLPASVPGFSLAWHRILDVRGLTQRLRSRVGTPPHSPCRPCPPLAKRR